MSATMPNEMNPRVANAHFVDMLSNMATPAWQSAVAMKKDGMRKAAIADAATLGYESCTTSVSLLLYH